MPFSLSPVRLAIALLCGAVVTGVFHLSRTAPGAQAIAADLAPANSAASLAAKSPAQSAARPAPRIEAKPIVAHGQVPRRIVFRHANPGVVVLTLQGDQLDVEFQEEQ